MEAACPLRWSSNIPPQIHDSTPPTLQEAVAFLLVEFQIYFLTSQAEFLGVENDLIGIQLNSSYQMKQGPPFFHHLAFLSTLMFRVPFTMWGHSHWIWALGYTHFGIPLFCYHMSNFIYFCLLSQLCPERQPQRGEVIYLGHQLIWEIQMRDHLTCVVGIGAPLLVISLLLLSRPYILNALI